MATTIKQDEAAPSAYPAAPSGLSDAAAALNADALWQRLEGYVVHRFSERAVTWIVEGPGEWCPPLVPATLDTVEIWRDDAWQSVTPPPSPVGGYDLGCATYRITATVGGGTVPADVNEAFRRLAEYSVEIGADGMLSGHPSHHSHSMTLEGGLSETFDRSPYWAARALQQSGAADLLRRYRRA